MSTLFELSQEANRLEELLLESGGELTPEFETWLEQINTQLEQKADSYAHVLDKLEANIALLRQNAKQYTDAARSLENAQTRIKDRIKDALEAMGKSKLSGNRKTFTLSNSSPRLVVNETELDQAYVIVQTQYLPDKERIKADLKEGKEIQGARLEGGKALRVTVSK
jgi:uncharacterized protein YukE